jgi:hypothetical protein
MRMVASTTTQQRRNIMTAPNTEIRELTTAEMDQVDGGRIWDFGLFRLAAEVFGNNVVLGVEIGGTAYCVQFGEAGFHVNVF